MKKMHGGTGERRRRQRKSNSYKARLRKEKAMQRLEYTLSTGIKHDNTELSQKDISRMQSEISILKLKLR